MEQQVELIVKREDEVWPRFMPTPDDPAYYMRDYMQMGRPTHVRIASPVGSPAERMELATRNQSGMERPQHCDSFQESTESHDMAHASTWHFTFGGAPISAWVPSQEESSGSAWVPSQEESSGSVWPVSRKELKVAGWYSVHEELEKVERERVKRRLFESESHDGVLEILRENDLQSYVEEYFAYLRQRQEDLEEDETTGVMLESLQSWAWFLVDYSGLPALPMAEISADFDGCLEMEWRLSPEKKPNAPYNEFYGNGRGIAVLTFYPAALNHLSILSGAYGGGRQRITLDCFLPHEMTIQIFDFFTERLLHPDAEFQT